MRCIVQFILLHLKKKKSQTWFASAIFSKTHLVLQNANHAIDIVDGVVVNNDRWSEVQTMVCMGGRRMEIGGSVWWHGEGVGGVIEMTWTLQGWGLMAKPALDLEGVKVGLGGGVVMLKQCQIELIKGYLAPRKYMY